MLYFNADFKLMWSTKLKYRKAFRFIFHRDHLFTVLMAATLTLLLVLISVNLSFFNPIKRALEDFSMTDIYYEILADDSTPVLSDKITIVDVTDLHERCAFANLMNQLGSMQPAVVGTDLIFEGNKDAECDNALVESLFHIPNLIVASKLVDYNVEKNCFTNVAHSYFESMTGFPFAYVNIVNNMTFHAVRKYSIFQRLNRDTIYSYPTKIVSTYLNRSPESFVREDNEPYIDYTKDVKFPVIRADSIQYWKGMIKGRIVLLGCMHEEADTHFTPLGKMAGVEIQAYSVLTQLNHRELVQMSTGLGVFLGFVVSYITAIVCFIISRRLKKIQYIMIKVFLFIEMALLVWLGFYCYVHFNYNINLLYPLLAVAMTETARFYYANLILYLRSKKGFFRVRNTIYI